MQGNRTAAALSVRESHRLTNGPHQSALRLSPSVAKVVAQCAEAAAERWAMAAARQGAAGERSLDRYRS